MGNLCTWIPYDESYNSCFSKEFFKSFRFTTLEFVTLTEQCYNSIFLVPDFSSGEWRDGSEVKNICCSCMGPEFGYQHPHGDSQRSVALVL